MALRGTFIPGEVSYTATRKYTAAGTIIPLLIRQHKARIEAYRFTAFAAVGALAAIHIACSVILADIRLLVPLIPVTGYIPGFRADKRRLERAALRFADMTVKYLTITGLSILLIDGEGYVRVAHQILANDYIFIYKEFRDIHFKLRVLQDFITAIQTINL
ncbi:hypothetical protein OAC51_03885 [Flavobacteriaceae bacterium]|nr:hypothetical protein [Flavobacteriaceae bacterium]